MHIAMSEHHCNTCNMKKEETMFTKFGKECAECKKKLFTGKREEYNQNRTRYMWRIYFGWISKGKTRENKGTYNFFEVRYWIS